MRRSVFRLTVLLCALMVLAPLRAQELYVTNLLANSVTVYTLPAIGNQVPQRTLAGAATELSNPTGIAVDTLHNELFVANFGSSGGASITVYPLAASGNVAPIRRITGAILVEPYGIAVDAAHDELFVASNAYPGQILVYPRTVSGAAAPARKLAGASVGFTNPISVAIDPVHDELWVANNCNGCGSSINAYARTASGDMPPLRRIASGPNLLSPVGLLVDTAHDEVIVTDAGNYGVLTFARTANGNVLAARTLRGSATGLTAPYGIALDADTDALILANEPANNLTTHARTATFDTPPLRTLSGSASGLNGPYFLALAGNTPLAITTSSPLPSGSVAVIYAQTFGASGGTAPYANWTVVSGALPPGLGLNAASGVLSGVPTAPGAFNFTVRVTDSSGNDDVANATASKNFSLTIAAPLPPPAQPVSAPAANTAGLALLILLSTAAGLIHMAARRRRSAHRI